MLIRLYGNNFRSLKNNFELSLVAADLDSKDDKDRGIVNVQIAGMSEPLNLLRTVAIFGANASGKSTVLTAARALRWLSTDSSNRSKLDANIPAYEPFLLDDMSRGAPITLGCDVVHERSILRYEIAYHAKKIESEKLVILNGEEENLLIDRQPSGNIGGHLIDKSDANRLYVKEMQPNISVLSKLAHHGPHQGDESAQPFYKSIRSSLIYEDYADFASMQKVGDPCYERFADDPDYRTWVMQHLMSKADIGIVDVKTSREALDVPQPVRDLIKHLGPPAMDFKFPDKAVDVSFIHSGISNQAIAFSNESSGTQKLFNISDDWWRLANDQVTLLADEFGASLHPRLLDRLIRAVNGMDASKFQSQLVFTTHETGLLEGRDGLSPALRRDQVYFTKKNANGESELYSLAEFKNDARPVHNIRKRYLSGIYGAIPTVEGLSL